MLNAIRSLAINIENPPTQSVSRDPHDDFLFAMAQAGGADYLVTGDKADVLALARHGKTQIVTVQKLIEIMRI